MQLFPKQILDENFKYHSDLSPEEFKTEINDLLHERNNFKYPPNLAGKFVSENEIKIVAKWRMPLFFQLYPTTNLIVTFSESNSNSTTVSIKVVPHSIYPMLFIFLPIICIYFSVTIPIEMKGAYFYAIMASIIIVGPIILLTLSKNSKRNLKDRFVKSLKLQSSF